MRFALAAHGHDRLIMRWYLPGSEVIGVLSGDAVRTVGSGTLQASKINWQGQSPAFGKPECSHSAHPGPEGRSPGRVLPFTMYTILVGNGTI